MNSIMVLQYFFQFKFHVKILLDDHFIFLDIQQTINKQSKKWILMTIELGVSQGR